MPAPAPAPAAGPITNATAVDYLRQQNPTLGQPGAPPMTQQQLVQQLRQGVSGAPAAPLPVGGGAPIASPPAPAPQQPGVVGGPRNVGAPGPPPAPGAYTPTGPLPPQQHNPPPAPGPMVQPVPAPGGAQPPGISNLMQMLQGGGMQSMMQQLFSGMGKGPQGAGAPPSPATMGLPGAGQAQMAMGQHPAGKGPGPGPGGPPAATQSGPQNGPQNGQQQ